jgi:hypothetical protein
MNTSKEKEYKEFLGKKIILVMPPDFELYKVFEQQLRYMGFDQVEVIAPIFRYDIKGRLLNFVQKTFLKNKAYKKELIDAHYSKKVFKTLDKFPKGSVDYAIVIRPDKLDIQTVEKIHQTAKKVVAYQWDGLARFPKVFRVLPLFERFFVFDPEDFHLYKKQYSNILPCTNFYIDIPQKNVTPQEKEVLYVGMYISDRQQSLLRIVNELSKYNLNLNINLFYGRRTVPFSHSRVTFTTKGMNFQEYLSLAQRTTILLDIKTVEHNGLSFRIFEAIKYEKKLITNNKTVKQYDFYHPNNIFVFEEDNFQGLEDFLKVAYTPLSEEIKQKYSFTNWLRYVLDIPPYKALNY